MRTAIRSGIALSIVVLVAVACGAGAATPTPTAIPPSVASVAPPAPTDTPPTLPPAIPIPTTDGEGAEYVVGTSSLTVTKPPTETVVGAVTQWRGQEMTSAGTMNDPRVNGTQRIILNLDRYQQVAAEWGTTRLENPGGAWEGTWTGASWDNGNATSVSGWLVGSGAYAGYTYYFHTDGEGMPFRVEGVIFPGSPPTS